LLVLEVKYQQKLKARKIFQRDYQINNFWFVNLILNYSRQSYFLRVKYHNNQLSFTDSKRHTVPVRLGDLPFPKAMEEYVFTGFVRQNHLMLEMLTKRSADIGPKLSVSAIFLPMVFPRL